MNVLHTRWLLPVILFVTAGCNSDIFIDDDQAPMESDVTLEPGGVSEFGYQGKDLYEMTLHLPGFGQMNEPNDPGVWEPEKPEPPYPTYSREDFDYVCRFCYDGGRCDTVVMRWGGWLQIFNDRDRELCRSLTVENAVVKFGLEFKQGRRVEIKNICNLTDSAFNCILDFEYRYKTDRIDVSVASTMPTQAGRYVVAGIEYDKDVWVKDDHSTDTIPFEAFNRGTDKLRVEFPIAPHCKMYTDFRINPDMAPLFGADQPKVDVEIPTYEHIDYGEGLSYGRAALYGATVPFSWQTVVAPGLDSAISPVLREIGYSFDHLYGFILSPNVGVRAYLYVYRVTNRVRGKLKARDIESGNEFFIPVDVVVNQPNFYALDYERVEL